MISSRLSLTLAVATALAAGCGNYSNEDLEYMNAVPGSEELFAELRASALAPADEAEWSRETHNAIAGFNGILFEILGGVDHVRSSSPSSRSPNSRTWGPFPTKENPGWQLRFVVTRQETDPPTFSYSVDLQNTADPAGAWIPYVTGGFVASSRARRGVGWLSLDSDALRAAGFPFDAGGQKIRSIDVTYSTKDYPVSVVMDLVSNPMYPDITIENKLHYEYGVQSDGRGAMKFLVTGDHDTTTPALETIAVTTRWMASGEGRADVTITLGDGVGLTQTECWDASFRATYTSDKPWTPVDETFQDPALCPEFTRL